MRDHAEAHLASAQWISAGPDGSGAARPARVFARRFVVPDAVESATLVATALGLYTAELNGERVGTAELLPGSTSYDVTVHAQRFDVAPLLVPGENVIELTLSDGWFLGEVGAFRHPAQWGERTAVRAELRVCGADGAEAVIATDGSWECTASPIVDAGLMRGQVTDFRVEPGEGVPVALGVVEAPRPSWSTAPPVRVVETRAATSAQEIRPGVWVLDFGQNASGWLQMADLGPRGTRTIIDHGEFVGADGDLDTSHLDSVRPGGSRTTFSQRDEVVAGGGGEVFEPRHTVHGFQYARIVREGAPFDPASVRMQVVHTDLERAGSFASSDESLNRLHEIADWSFRGNAVDVPTDCPTRERMGWTGDYQVFAPTATRLYDVLGFSRKWLQSVRDDQLPDGRIANFSPDGRRIKEHLDDQLAMMTGSAGWGDAIVAVPWEMHLAYGDTEVLAENWDAMVRWVSWQRTAAAGRRHAARAAAHPEPQPFEQYLWDGTFHWGEWLEPRKKDADGRDINPVQDDPTAWFMADKGEVGTAYFFRSVRTLADIARVLGKDASAYDDLAPRIRDAWRSAYLGDDGRTCADTQASYVRALAFGLIPDELVPRAVDRLVECVREASTHLTTGFLSTAHLLPVLADHGRADVAYELLMQRTAPSWLTMVDRGATTIWEEWEGIDADGRAHESLNHYSKGAVIRFLHTHALGLRQEPGGAGWRDVLIAPVPGGGLTWARGHHDGPQGRITVSWRIDAGRFALDVGLPEGTAARIVLPSGEHHRAGPGQHSFSD
ncbi:alpha-L-rhamnosidase [Microbacterium halophytorum]|uniref:alpha-L-rhamnosidase n=1 Tax=Microbacterium halophytorum TaxID=2067568 RepID=UPI001E500D2C|nr:alpha-L-rhamnosidase [Microbacterium halophytorum]